VILTLKYHKIYKSNRVNTLFREKKMIEQSKSNKEILERMPEWFLILRQAYKEQQDKTTKKEVNPNEHKLV